MNRDSHQVFLTGGTGYIGSRLASLLLSRGHRVRALVRESSRGKLPAGCEAVIGDAVAAGYGSHVPPADTFIHLVGVSHPSPWKADQFRSIDLASLRAAVHAAKEAQVPHFIFNSVAQPAPMMRAYVAVRGECEQAIRDSGLNATILRPWYVLGPGHRWPYALLPIYWLLERLPATRESARRLGLVDLSQMLDTLVAAVESSAQGVRVWGVEEIRHRGRAHVK